MGSTGSGRFSDYPGSRPKEGGQGGGSSGEDRCAKALSCALEELEKCEYVTENASVPPANEMLSLSHRGRIFAIDANGKTVGALPTKFNYLADCLAAGFVYEGRVTSSVKIPTLSVDVDFVPRLL